VDTKLALIETERQGDTLILTPQQDLRELQYQAIEEEQVEVLLKLAADPLIRNVVVDFGKTDYFGSTALSLLLRLRQAVRGRGGRMVLCNVSAHEQEVLEATRLAEIWRVCTSRDQAVEALND
jgi:stage II sporulation protein AA (anti-sigma F factor antagonist)